jgi:tetratricopeptide (TPR) repeat protein
MRLTLLSALLFWMAEPGTYERAVSAFQYGRFDEVLSLLASLPEAEAKRPAAQNLRSLALSKTGRYEEALSANAEALRLDPGNTNYLFNTAMICLDKGDPAAAESVLRRGAEAMPEASRLHEGLGETLFQMGRFDEAERSFRRAAALDPSSVSARLALAKIFYALGDRPNFETAAREAIRMAPENYLACYYFGKYLIEQKEDFREGAKYIEKSCALAPGFVEGLIARGELLSRDLRWEDAARVYEKARERDPRNPQVYYLLALAYRKSGSAEKAEWALHEFDRLRNR